MNKKLLHISLCATYILFSVTPMVHAHRSRTPRNPVFDVFDEINRSFANESLFDPYLGFAHREPSLEAKSLNETLKKLEAETLYIHERARRLRNLLYGSTTKKNDLINETKDTQKELQKTTTLMSKLITEMNANLADVVDRSKYQVKEYEAEEYESGDTTIYGIKISLPGFDQNNIKVAIITDDKKGKSHHRLEVTGTKQVTTATEEEKDVNGKKVVVKKIGSQAFLSSLPVKNGQKIIEYKDGNIKIKIDLPNDIETQEGRYTMAFDNDVLKLEFPKQTTATKTPLKYTTDTNQQS